MATDPTKWGPTARHGFTLLEMLAVMSIVAMVLAWITPSLSSLIAGNNLDRAGMLVADYLALARQEAVSMNRDIEVRFVDQIDGSQTQVRGIQLWRIDEGVSGSVAKAITRVIWLPEQIIVNLSENYSPLLASAEISGSMDVAGTKMTYRGFRIRANGMVVSSVDKMFITMQNANESVGAPKNFYTVGINPLNSKVTSYRP